MSRSQTEETTQDTTAVLSKEHRRKIIEVTREKADTEIDKYTTVGELQTLIREVVRSDAVRREIAAPYEAKVSVAVHALAEQLREEISQHL